MSNNDPNKIIPVKPINDRSMIELVEEEDDVREFNYEHRPWLGLLVLDPPILILPERGFMNFNDPAIPVLAKVKQGDIINVTINKEDEAWKKWAPSKEYQLPEGYSDVFYVQEVTKDLEDRPIIVAVRSS